MPAPRRRASVLIALVLALSGAPAAHAGVPSSTPDPGAWVPDASADVAIRDGGTTWLGGSFAQIGPWTGSAAGINVATGATDTGFPVVAGGKVLAMVPDTVGGAYVAGSFTSVDGQPRHGLAHINFNGALDATFAPSADDDVDSLALSPSGGTLYLGGHFTTIDGQPRAHLAAVGPFGGALTSWNPCTASSTSSDTDGGAVYGLTVSADSGTVYAGGDFDEVGATTCASVNRTNVAAFSAATGAPTAFAPIVGGNVKALALGGSSLYLGGTFGLVGSPSVNRKGMAAVAVSTGAPTAFAPDPDSFVDAIVVSGSTIYAGGPFTTIGTNGASRKGVAALSTAGAATAFDAHLGNGPLSGYAIVDSLALTTGATPRLLAGGFLTVPGGAAELASLDPATGTADGSFAPRPGGPVLALAPTSSGHAFLGGSFNSVGAVTRTGIVQLDAFGHPTAFALPGPRQYVTHMVLSPDRTTLFTTGFFDGGASQTAAAWSAATGARLAWAPVLSGQVDSLAVSPDGTTVYLGGTFPSVDGAPRVDLAAVTATGTGTILPWRPDPDGEVDAIAPSPDGSVVYAGGLFTHIGPSVVARSRLAALSLGGDPTGWNPGPDGSVGAITATRDGSHVYVAGTFSHIGTAPVARAGIADLTSGTGNATPFSGEIDDYSASTIAVPDDEATIYAGGYFQKAFGVPRGGIVALQGGTGSQAAWEPELSHYNQVVSVAAQDDTVVLGGWFAYAGSDMRPYYAQYSSAPVDAAPPSLGAAAVSGAAVHCDAGTWRNGPQLSVDWLLDGTPVAGATGRTYTPGPAEVGRALACRETGANPAGSAAATSSSAVVTAPSSPGGAPGGGPPPPGSVAKPAALRLAAALRRHSRSRVAIAVTLSAAAKVHVTVVLLPRHAHGRARTVLRSAAGRRGGRTTLTLRRRHGFAAGHYRISLVATGAHGARSKTIVLRVTLR